MTEKKLNCWDFHACQENTEQCPAYTQDKGRSCWEVAGTFCKGKVQGSYAQKLGDCRKCEFYSYVKKQNLRRVGRAVAVELKAAG